MFFFLSLSLSFRKPPKNESLKGTRKSRISRIQISIYLRLFSFHGNWLAHGFVESLHLSIVIIKHRELNHASRELREIFLSLRRNKIMIGRLFTERWKEFRRTDFEECGYNFFSFKLEFECNLSHTNSILIFN